MTVTQDNYLDFTHIIIEEIIGSVTITAILGFIVIAYLHVKFRLPYESALVSSLLWIMFIVSYAYNALVLMLGVIVAGLVVFSFLPKLTRR